MWGAQHAVGENFEYSGRCVATRDWLPRNKLELRWCGVCDRRTQEILCFEITFIHTSWSLLEICVPCVEWVVVHELPNTRRV